jgi:hypothetical protein
LYEERISIAEGEFEQSQVGQNISTIRLDVKKRIPLTAREMMHLLGEVVEMRIFI